MTETSIDPAIHQLIADVVNRGSAYDLDAMDRLYTADESYLILGGDGHVTRVARADMMAEFKARRDEGDAPLSTEHRILHVEQQDDHATAILYRRMNPDYPAAMYELRMRKEADRWQVAGETVTPWPGGIDGSVLPPRERAA